MFDLEGSHNLWFNALPMYAGRAGGRKLANDLIANLEEEGEISLNKLQKMILGES